MTIISTFFVLLVVSFLNRCIVVRKAVTGFDTYGHLYYAKERKEQKTGFFGPIITKVVGSDGHSEPLLWHWVIGVFPIRKIVQHQQWINASIDAAFSVLIYLLTLRIGFANDTAIIVALLYLFTPMFFSRLSTGPRISDFTPRLASELATTLFFIVTLLPLGIPIWGAVFLGAALSGFVLSSSKFGLQALFFLTPLTSLVAWNATPMVALAIGVTVVIGVTRGAALDSFRGQIIFLQRYFKKTLKGEMPISRRNSLAELIRKPSSGEGYMKHIGVVLLRMTSLNSYTSVLLKMPVLLVACALYAVSFLSGVDQPPRFIVGPVIAAVIIFFLVNLPPLLFLGEAERYLNHVAFFILVMAASLTRTLGSSWLLWFVIAYGLLYWFVESFYLHKLLRSSSQSKQDIDDAVISYLNLIENPAVILAYPYDAVGVWRLMLETKHKVIFTYTASKDFMTMFDKQYAADEPYVKLERLDEMANELGVEVLIASNRSLVLRGHTHWVPSSLWQKVDVGAPIYAVYKRVFHHDFTCR